MPGLVPHSAAVSLRCEWHAVRLGLPEEEVALAAIAGLWHDAGKLPTLASHGFHPLDGAWAVSHLGEERLANLIAYHSGAAHEAELRGLTLEPFEPETSLVADILACCDLSTGPDGVVLSFDERLADIERRYGPHSVEVSAQRAFADELARARARTGL